MQIELKCAPHGRTLWRVGLLGLLFALLVLLGLALRMSWQAAGSLGAEPGLSPRSQMAFRQVVSRPILALTSSQHGVWYGAVDGLYHQAAGGEAVRLLPRSEDPLPLNVHAIYATGEVLYLGFTRLPVEMDQSGGYTFRPIDAPNAGEVRAGIAAYAPATGEWQLLQTETPAWGFATWQDVVYGNTNQGVYALTTGERVGPPTEALGFVLHGTPDALYAGMQDGIWRWDGARWEQVLPTEMQKVLGFGELEGQLYAAVSEQGLYRSQDGLTWERVAEEPSLQALAVDARGQRLYLGGEGLWRYDPALQTLESVKEIQAQVRGLASQGGTLYLGTNRAAYRQVTGEVGR